MEKTSIKQSKLRGLASASIPVSRPFAVCKTMASGSSTVTAKRAAFYWALNLTNQGRLSATRVAKFSSGSFLAKFFSMSSKISDASGMLATTQSSNLVRQ
eukprot:5996062-Amphidinium_carterae.2